MPTLFIHRFDFCVPISPENLVKMQRFGIALFAQIVPEGQPDLTDQRRIDIATGVVPIEEALLYDIPGVQEESKNFQEKYSLTPDGSTADMYVGAFTMTEANRVLLASAIAANPITGLLFGRSTLDETEEYAFAATNIPSLAGAIGQYLSSMQVIAAMGIVPYTGE